MPSFNSEQLAVWSSGEWVDAVPQVPVTGFCHDSRKVKAGDLFIAIKTQERDGHDFLSNARENGAAGALVSETRPDCSLPQLKVVDTLQALRDCAAAYRETWDAEVIGITGSCGKTTTKDLLSLLLGEEPEVHATLGNLNNTIGVPLTLLGAEAERCRYAIIEAGISEIGEMELMAHCIKPSLAVFTAIGPSHLEGLLDEDTVAREKGLLAQTGSTRKAFLGDSCQVYADHLFEGSRVLLQPSDELETEWSYSTTYDNGYTQLSLRTTEGVESFRYRGYGNGLACNVSLSIAVAKDLGVTTSSIQDRISNWVPGGMRGEWVEIGPSRIFLDCYNANPVSMRDALESFIVMSVGDRPRLYILGSMEELGGAAPLWHQRLGRELTARPEDIVFLVGEHADSIYQGIQESGNSLSNTTMLHSIDELEDRELVFEGDIFVKGSRKHHLEDVLSYVENWSVAKEEKC